MRLVLKAHFHNKTKNKLGYRGQTGRIKAPFILLIDIIRISDHKSPSLSFFGL